MKTLFFNILLVVHFTLLIIPCSIYYIINTILELFFKIKPTIIELTPYTPFNFSLKANKPITYHDTKFYSDIFNYLLDKELPVALVDELKLEDNINIIPPPFIQIYSIFVISFIVLCLFVILYI